MRCLLLLDSGESHSVESIKADSNESPIVPLPLPILDPLATAALFLLPEFDSTSSDGAQLRVLRLGAGGSLGADFNKNESRNDKELCHDKQPTLVSDNFNEIVESQIFLAYILSLLWETSRAHREFSAFLRHQSVSLPCHSHVPPPKHHPQK
jgi:hypothetical protein